MSRAREREAVLNPLDGLGIEVRGSHRAALALQEVLPTWSGSRELVVVDERPVRRPCVRAESCDAGALVQETTATCRAEAGSLSARRAHQVERMVAQLGEGRAEGFGRAELPYAIEKRLSCEARRTLAIGEPERIDVQEDGDPFAGDLGKSPEENRDGV